MVSSKLDQYAREPFAMFKHVVHELILSILTQSTRVMQEWKQAVLRVLGANGSLVIDVFPSLQHLIGAQPEVPQLAPAEAQQRLQLVVTSFLCCFCTRKRPLVMFFDDVQWSDEDSLEQLQLFVNSPACHHVLIILAYRAEEMHAQHPLMQLLPKLRQQPGLAMHSITCSPLSLSDLQQLVVDTLRCSPAQALVVASMLEQRTAGNPFFVRQLLLQLHRDGLIAHDPATAAWKFDSAAFISSQQQTASSILELVQQLVRSLSPSTQQLLSLAACIGTKFDADTLALIGQLPTMQVELSLREALQEELIVADVEVTHNPVSLHAGADAPVEFVSSTPPARVGASVSPLLPSSRVCYSFVHDRIQQGAYFCIPQAVRSSTHLRLARLLHAARKMPSPHVGGANGSSRPMVDDQTFDIANQYLNGMDALLRAQTDSVTDEQREEAKVEQRSVAKFLLHAAATSKRAGSYQAGLRYVKAGQYLLGLEQQPPMLSSHELSAHSTVDAASTSAGVVPELALLSSLWIAHHSLSLHLCSERGELEYLCGHVAEAERQLTFGLSLSEPLMDRVLLYQQLLGILTGASKFAEAIRVSRRALAELGRHLPLSADDMTDDERAQAAVLPVSFDNLRYLPCSPQLSRLIYSELLRQIGDRPILSLVDLPELTDEKEAAATRIMSLLVPAAVFADRPLLTDLCYLSLLHALQFGFSGSECYAIVCLGVSLTQDRAEVLASTPQLYGRLGVALMEKYDVRSLKARTLIGNSIWLQHWTTDAQKANEMCEEGLQAALDNGDLLFASYSPIVDICIGNHYRTVPETVREVDKALARLKATRSDKVTEEFLAGQRLWIAALTSLTPELVDSASFQAEADAFLVRADRFSPLSSAPFLIQLALAQYIMGRHQQALDSIAKAKPRSPYIQGFPDTITMAVIETLATLRRIREQCQGSMAATPAPLSPSSPAFVRAESWQRVLAHLEQVAVWTQACPTNFQPHLTLLTAERDYTLLVEQLQRGSVTDKEQDAAIAAINDLYREATRYVLHGPDRKLFSLTKAGSSPSISFTSSSHSVNPWLRAVCREQFLRFSLASGQSEIFRALLLDTMRLYEEYGAVAKLSAMMDEYKEYVSMDLQLYTRLQSAKEAREAGAGKAKVEGRTASRGERASRASLSSLSSAGSTSSSSSSLSPRSSDSVADSANQPPRTEPPIQLVQSVPSASGSSSSSLSSSSTSRSPSHLPTAAVPSSSPGLSSPSSHEAFSHPSEGELQEQSLDGSSYQSGAQSSYLGDGASHSESELRSELFTDFDLHTIIKATQALTKEVQLSKLLSTLLDILQRSCGAERAILFTNRSAQAAPAAGKAERGAEHDEQKQHEHAAARASSEFVEQAWQIDAMKRGADVVDEATRASSFVSSASRSSFAPASVMNYVLHSRKPLMLSDARSDPMFGRDEFITRHGVRSLLCIPLLHHDSLVNILYLDNCSTVALFNRKRLLLCRFIMAQASISVDNAKLYEQLAFHAETLEQAVHLRTKELEEATQAASDASAAKSRFLANMSHEVRTPMNGVLGGVDLLMDESMSGNLTAEQREILSIIRVSGEAMLTIINDILDLSKIEAGRVELKLEPFPLRDCVESAIDVVAGKAYSKALEVQYKVDADVPYLIYSDSKRLMQILFNLLSNATKFTHRGDITVEVRVVGADAAEVDASPAPRPYELQVSVRDTGIGISLEAQERLFLPFSQVHLDSPRNASTASAGGTGLGLVISKHLVQLMGGRIWIDSQPGAGAVFSFTMKVHGSDQGRPEWLQPPIAPLTSSVGTDKPLSGRRILLVHPLQHTRDLITAALATWGVETVAVASVDAACHLLSTRDPALSAVLVDYRLLGRLEEVPGSDSDVSHGGQLASHTGTARLTSNNRTLDDGDVPRLASPAEMRLLEESLQRTPVGRYTPDMVILTRLTQSALRASGGGDPSTEQPGSVRVIVLSPLSQQRSIRALNGGRSASFLTTPIKAQHLYHTLKEIDGSSSGKADLAHHHPTRAYLSTQKDSADTVHSGTASPTTRDAPTPSPTSLSRAPLPIPAVAFPSTLDRLGVVLIVEDNRSSTFSSLSFSVSSSTATRYCPLAAPALTLPPRADVCCFFLLFTV